jgi:hypothetical protein
MAGLVFGDEAMWFAWFQEGKEKSVSSYLASGLYHDVSLVLEIKFEWLHRPHGVHVVQETYGRLHQSAKETHEAPKCL